jgi:hypothetical protein
VVDRRGESHDYIGAEEGKHVICELDASRASEERIEAALAYASEHDAELTFVSVVDPRTFGSASPVAARGIGTWGLPLLLARAAERARKLGVAASTAVLIGAREHVLDEKEQAANADALYTARERVVRCPRCGWRHDPRGVHYCPTEHLAAPRTQLAHNGPPTLALKVQRRSSR